MGGVSNGPCPACGGSGWVVVERRGIEAAAECECRQQRLKQQATLDMGTPLTEAAALGAAYEFTSMAFFPQEELKIQAVAREIFRMCSTREQAQWLVAKVKRTFPKAWPGDGEMRAAFCTRFRPKDGFVVGSEIYKDTGIPSDAQQLDPSLLLNGLPAPPTAKALPPGRTVSSDPEMDGKLIAAAKQVRRISA